MAHKRSAMFEWHLPLLRFMMPTGPLLQTLPSHGSQEVYCSSKFHNFANTSPATLAWHLKISPGGSQQVCYVGIANSTLGLLTKQRPATLEWQHLPLSFNLAKLKNGLLRWNGSLLLKMFPSGGSQKVCYLGPFFV